MEKIENHKDKLTDYYKKAKTMGQFIFDCSDIEKISSLYQHYFQLLDKMSFHNRKIMSLYDIKNKKLNKKEYDETHNNLENQIKKWKKDAMKKYKEIQEWFNKGKELRNEKYVIENQIAKLQLLYNEQQSITEKMVLEKVKYIDQYIIHNINTVIDFLLALSNNDTTNIQIVSSLYRISNIIKNIGITDLKKKQNDFDEVYKTIKGIEIDETVSKSMNDVMEYISKRNQISTSYYDRDIENITDEKLIEYIKELKTNENMINNNKDILNSIIEKQKEHTKNSFHIIQ